MMHFCKYISVFPCCNHSRFYGVNYDEKKYTERYNFFFERVTSRELETYVLKMQACDTVLTSVDCSSSDVFAHLFARLKL